jgi:hypothetical protein
MSLEAAQAADVLFVVAAVNDRARAQEQQGLEECVGDEVEHADSHPACTQAQHHEAQL